MIFEGLDPMEYKNYLENLVYHFSRQLWLVLGVELMEINSNLFSRHPFFFTTFFGGENIFFRNFFEVGIEVGRHKSSRKSLKLGMGPWVPFWKQKIQIQILNLQILNRKVNGIILAMSHLHKMDESEHLWKIQDVTQDSSDRMYRH